MALDAALNRMIVSINIFFYESFTTKFDKNRLFGL